MIELTGFPSQGWIGKLNENRRFSGSVGTRPDGSLHVHIFRYRIWTREEKDDEGNSRKYLCCSCYIQPPAASRKEPYGQAEAAFDFVPANVNAVKEWLQQQAAQHEEIGKA